MTYSDSSDRNSRLAELRRRSAERRAAGPQVGDVVDISEELAFEASLTGGRKSETQPVTKTVSPPPDKLNAQQVASFTDLIQTSPPNEIWQNHIEAAKTQFPEQLGNVTAVNLSLIHI